MHAFKKKWVNIIDRIRIMKAIAHVGPKQPCSGIS